MSKRGKKGKKVTLTVPDQDAMTLVFALVEEAKDFDLGYMDPATDRAIIKDVISKLDRANQVLKAMEDAGVQGGRA